jgi:formate hydrogenlyase subunit 5
VTGVAGSLEQLEALWPDRLRMRRDSGGRLWELESDSEVAPEICGRLFGEFGYNFGALIAEERRADWELRYVFYGGDAGIVQVVTRQPLGSSTFRTLIGHVHAADWDEREVEDLFGLSFAGHPRLGDFVLHNDRWDEGLAPMRKSFDAHSAGSPHRGKPDWRPLLVLEAPGAFVMPIGPIYSGVAESALFLLETQGEDVARALPRLFYKYRAIEKIAEGRSPADALLLAERCNGTSAFAHGLAFCQAAEAVCGAEPPRRARTLRVLLAELERLRHHVAAIHAICESTGLAVATSQAAILEEELLSLSCGFTGHRYLFGLNMIGGLTRDFGARDCVEAVTAARGILARLEKLEEMLRFSSSFLDRLEEVGVVSEQEARVFGLVGPIARASGVARDLRKLQPYSGYDEFVFDVPREAEGDGYARLRLLFGESRQAAQIMEQAIAALAEGPVCAEPVTLRPGAALGWVEAPRGAAFHWLRIAPDGAVARYRLSTPSFANWNGFHLAAEDFTFQDFPIILATFGLSAAENDR